MATNNQEKTLESIGIESAEDGRYFYSAISPEQAGRKTVELRTTVGNKLLAIIPEESLLDMLEILETCRHT